MENYKTYGDYTLTHVLTTSEKINYANELAEYLHRKGLPSLDRPFNEDDFVCKCDTLEDISKQVQQHLSYIRDNPPLYQAFRPDEYHRYDINADVYAKLVVSYKDYARSEIARIDKELKKNGYI